MRTMMTRLRRSLLGTSLALAIGCGGSNVVEPSVAKKHGATHLSCTPEQVTVSKLDDTTWKADGCAGSVVLTCWTSVGQGEGTCTKQ